MAHTCIRSQDRQSALDHWHWWQDDHQRGSGQDWSYCLSDAGIAASDFQEPHSWYGWNFHFEYSRLEATGNAKFFKCFRAILSQTCPMFRSSETGCKSKMGRYGRYMCCRPMSTARLHWFLPIKFVVFHLPVAGRLPEKRNVRGISPKRHPTCKSSFCQDRTSEKEFPKVCTTHLHYVDVHLTLRTPIWQLPALLPPAVSGTWPQ